jgi:lysophospholipase L1-like esterase
MKKIILLISLTFSTVLAFSQIAPADFISLSKPLYKTGSGVDARSQIKDKSVTPNTVRDYVSTAEVLTYLSNSNSGIQALIRSGGYEVLINTGGTLSAGVITGGIRNVYWFKNGISDTSLVLKQANVSAGYGVIANSGVISLDTTIAVTKNTTQTITGTKIFTGDIKTPLPPYSAGGNLPVVLNTATNRLEKAVGGGYESAANKVTSLTTPDNIHYPTTLAVSNAIPSVDASAITLPQVGPIIADNFNRASIGANYTITGSSTFEIVSNQLRISSSATTYVPFSNYALYNAYGKSNFESFTITEDIIPGTINATSFGTGINLKGQGLYPSSTSITLRLDAANLGHIQFDCINNATSISQSGLSISSGDHIVLTIKFIKNKFIVSANNVTTNTTNTVSYDISTAYTPTYDSDNIRLPSAYQYALISAGGTQNIDNLMVVSNDNTGVSYGLIGDSITKGSDSDNILNRWGEQINQVNNVITQTLAGAGTGIVDLNLPEILSIQAKALIVLIGINDLGSGLYTDAQVQTNYSNFITSLVANGYQVGVNLFVCTLLPNSNGLNTRVITFNTWLRGQYGTAVIDFYTPLVNSTGTGLNPLYTLDNIHPNFDGQGKMTDAAIAFLGLPSKPKKQGNYFPALYNANGFVTLASPSLRASEPSNQATILSEGQKSQVLIHNSTDKNGLYLGDYNGYSHILNGAYRDENGNYIATATAGSGVSMQGGREQHIYWNNATIGSTFTPQVGLYQAGNQFVYGGITRPYGVINTFGPDGTAQLWMPPVNMYGTANVSGQIYNESQGNHLMFISDTWRKSLDAGIFSQYLNANIASTTTTPTTSISTGQGAFIIPPYMPNAGKKIVLKQMGYITTVSGGGNANFGFYLEGNLICSASATAITLPIATLVPYEIEITLIFTDETHFYTFGRLLYSTGNNTSRDYSALNNGTTLTTISGNRVLDIKANFSNAMAGQAIVTIENTITAAN